MPSQVPFGGLAIVESPAKAKTIQGCLGPGFDVDSALATSGICLTAPLRSPPSTRVCHGLGWRSTSTTTSRRSTSSTRRRRPRSPS